MEEFEEIKTFKLPFKATGFKTLQKIKLAEPQWCLNMIDAKCNDLTVLQY